VRPPRRGLPLRLVGVPVAGRRARELRPDHRPGRVRRDAGGLPCGAGADRPHRRPAAGGADETRRTVAALGARVDAAAVLDLWDSALAATSTGPPVWFHGDVAAGNLLVRDGRLAAVIDFGCSGVGDPACDLAIAWTLFSGGSRRAFRAALGVDDATWARGRGWVLWKALITLDGSGAAQPDLDAVLAP
jgi:aminoglycoside phosphotransferase (APT) family kinase protein